MTTGSGDWAGFSPLGSTHDRGRAAEQSGARWLEAQGIAIRERNYRTHVGEIDLIALDEETLCFVEVKARETTSYGPAVSGVSLRQQRRVVRAAMLYLASDGWDGPCRFDVLAMDRDGDDWRFDLVRDAFEADPG